MKGDLLGFTKFQFRLVFQNFRRLPFGKDLHWWCLQTKRVVLRFLEPALPVSFNLDLLRIGRRMDLRVVKQSLLVLSQLGVVQVASLQR